MHITDTIRVVNNASQRHINITDVAPLHVVASILVYVRKFLVEKGYVRKKGAQQQF